MFFVLQNNLLNKNVHVTDELHFLRAIGGMFSILFHLRFAEGGKWLAVIKSGGCKSKVM